MKIEIVSENVSSSQLNGNLKKLGEWCGQHFVASDNALCVSVPESYDGSEYRITITVEVEQTKKPKKG